MVAAPSCSPVVRHLLARARCSGVTPDRFTATASWNDLGAFDKVQGHCPVTFFLQRTAADWGCSSSVGGGAQRLRPSLKALHVFKPSAPLLFGGHRAVAWSGA
jgi:hypothetical protein